MGKKKGKKEKASTGGLESTGLEESEVRTLEYYQVKVADLTEKLDRLKSKNELLVKENTTLAKAQAKFYSDKQDIVEFLNIKVGEHEKMIANLEVKNKALDLEKRTIEQRMKQDFDLYQKTAQEETEQLHAQVSRLKSELTELNQFQKQKADLDEQLKHVKHLLERKEKEFAETIHNLERKVLQDKSQMKREMLQKVNEAVANFRRVADQQMAETTKRAIRENMAISSQLKKMSVKTVELIEENDQLHAQVEKLKKGNQLLVDSEKELAKRNISSQKAVKMLIEKLKESDQMLELAFDEPEKEPEPDKQYLTEEMIQEMRGLEDDYNLLIDRIGEVNTIGHDMSMVLQEAKNATEKNKENVVLEYLISNLPNLVSKLKTLTDIQGNRIQNEVVSLDGDDGYKESEFPEIDAEEVESFHFPEEDMAENVSESSQSSQEEFKKPQTLTIIPKKPGQLMTEYQHKVNVNFIKMIIPKSPKIVKNIIDDQVTKEIGIQTMDIKFGPKINTDYLLGEVRPWGPKSEHLPQKGLGLYFSRQVKLDRPKSIENMHGKGKPLRL